MEDENKKKLINEKITGRKLTPGRILKYAVLALLCGSVFGAASTYTSRIISRHAETTETESSSAGETLPSESPSEESSEESIPEGSAAGPATEKETPEETASESEPESVSEPETAESKEENDSETEPEESAYTFENEEVFHQAVLDLVPDAVEKAAPYLVSVTVTSQTPTWFESNTEHTETYAGIIISSDEKEILILTTCMDFNDKTVKAVFRNGNSSDAYLKQYSLTDGLSVLAVSATEGISEETLESVTPAEYGDTESLRSGSSLIAVGAPIGVNGSSTSGRILYLNPAETAVDCQQQVFYSNVISNSEKGTFLIDFQGRLLGVASAVPSEINETNGLTRIISITSLEGIIKAMLAGEKKAFLGINGVSVDFNMKYSNVPEGVYVSNVIQDSPAYTAGIRRGDVIINVTDTASDRSITDMDVLSRAINAAKPGDLVRITLMRSDGNEYRELEVEVTFGER